MSEWVVRANLVTGFLLAGALVADRLLARRVGAGVRLALYLVVIGRVALPMDWSTALGLIGARGGGGAVVIGEPSLSAAVATVASGWSMAVVVYGAVALALLARWVSTRVALARRLRGARPLPAIDGLRVCEHPSIGPVLAGMWRPRVVLPAALLGDPEALRCVLAHEGAHVARGDHLLAAALQLACIAAWPVLPVWIAARRIRALMELACDERAVAGADVAGRQRYGQVLLAVAARAPGGDGLVPAFGSELRARVAALAPRRRWPRAGQLAVAGALGAALLACSAAPEPDETRQAAVASQPPPTGSAPGQRGGKVPDVIPGQANVRGSLDKEVIRRIIRRHINEVKYCYEQELAKTPGLGGRVVVQFTISATGTVVSSAVQSSTMGNAVVELCTALAVRRWEFPKPLGGGGVMVSYPFVLAPA